MELRELSLKEWLSVCERAEGACAQRLREISGRADPADAPLLRFLGSLVSEEEAHLDAIRQFSRKVPGPPVWLLDEMLLDHLVRSRFPSFGQGFGEGRLSRDNALYYAECVEKESSRFYRALSEEAPDPESRDFFRTVAEGEESHLKHIQTTLL